MATLGAGGTLSLLFSDRSPKLNPKSISCKCTLSMKGSQNFPMDVVWESPENPPKPEDYIFRDGMRLVKPYYFEFISHVKSRWVGKTIVDLFTHEFRQRPQEYYLAAVNAGRIQVDDQMVHVSYVVQSSQKISHFVHRHEPPVMAWGVSILEKGTDVVTVCKPASVPVHPCGQYRKNTVVGILEAERDIAPLFLHRLDRLVSGLLILARSAAAADRFRKQIEAGKVKKEYIAKVLGVFPEEEQVVDANVDYDAREGKSSVELWDGDHCNRTRKGKVASTRFTRISTNGIQSIVKCEPLTGRTHQIRVHLQYLGYPIGNDALYLSETVSLRSAKRTCADRATTTTVTEDCEASGSVEDHQISEKLTESGEMHPKEDFRIDPMCTNCPNLAPHGYDGHEEGLWLHCVRYSGPNWTYECPYPTWAFIE
ncbi:RNA pseudouridine synthase 7 isoform X2 [Amborella trichopoda]|uniref:RNA pseudouridine synthase 7 isoform X2 n=1 Tax=Amborella trichopoda TaxID=13333 RepID=UPI0005D3CA20|nr:RNA pseudouridine synthase 7 isoform X2 [Amborella trichopoda]|eukprot:XP_011623443.1 RNA pseudouridine synthase 7 isoform X2 [Amborella trichopoda]